MNKLQPHRITGCGALTDFAGSASSQAKSKRAAKFRAEQLHRLEKPFSEFQSSTSFQMYEENSSQVQDRHLFPNG